MASNQRSARDVELVLLRTFLAVLDYGSLRKAAEAINVTQAAVSQQMLRLEKVVGQTLFARGRSGVTLTHHGELLVNYANRAVDLNDEILLRFRGDRFNGPVTVGMSSAIAMGGLTTVLQRFQNLQPEVELRVLHAAAPKIDALLTSGEIHLAVAEPSLMRRDPTARWHVQLAWAALRNFQLDQSRSVPLVLFDGPCSWRDSLLGSLRQVGREWRIAFESSSLDAILAATQSGLGVSPLPIDFVRNSRLVPLDTDTLPAAPRVEFGVFGSSVLPASARTLVEVIQTYTEQFHRSASSK